MKILIVIDMQNDFIEGALGTKEAVSIVDSVIERIENSKGELILFTRDTHQEDYLETSEGKKLPVIHCIEGSKGWEINEKVQRAWLYNEDTIVLPQLNNNTFDKPVFGSVKLVEFLKDHEGEITEIELLGVCTDICVISNGIMIRNTLPDVKLIVNSSCCAGVTPGSHNKALEIMEMCQIDIK
jgi:nicotinamidase-related amidase